MLEMSVTEFSRNLRKVFDKIEHKGEEVVLVRNKHRIARILPGSSHLTAIEAMGDLYRTLPVDAGVSWVAESRIGGALETELENKWDS